MASFDELVAEAITVPFSGWDFSWLDARSSTTSLPWSYRSQVASRAAAADTMLDMGTGGGEWLSRLTPRPGRTLATESWPPNVSVAADRLRPLGIGVIHCAGAPDNMSEAAASPGYLGLLPFRDGAFDLVINRHESFRGDEVCRVLGDGGTFITQQVDYHSDDELHRLLGLEPPATADSWLPLAVEQLTSAGLTVTAHLAGEQIMSLHDVSAVIYYLKIVDWKVPGYRLDDFLPRLRAAHDHGAWPMPVIERRFLVVAGKPSGDVTGPGHSGARTPATTPGR